jgi:hypothetical protein
VRDDLVELGVAPAERFSVIGLGINLEERLHSPDHGAELRRLYGILAHRFTDVVSDGEDGILVGEGTWTGSPARGNSSPETRSARATARPAASELITERSPEPSS